MKSFSRYLSEADFAFPKKKQRIQRWMITCPYCKKVFAMEQAPWQAPQSVVLDVVERHIEKANCEKTAVRLKFRIKPHYQDRDLPIFKDTAARQRAAYDYLTADCKIRQVEGVENDEVQCGPKCMASKGPTCECSCGGKNHGMSWV